MCSRHPVADRPLIDWDLILVMEPAAMVGAVFGGFLTQTLPQWLTTCLLFGVLVFMSHNLWGKARKTWAKESAAKARAAEALASSAPDVHLSRSQTASIFSVRACWACSHMRTCSESLPSYGATLCKQLGEKKTCPLSSSLLATA